MKPPYKITGKILSLIASISEKIGEVNSAHLQKPPTKVRKENRIKTIQSSSEIEGNTLTVEQITSIIENKRIIGSKEEILEVKNAIAVYDIMESFKRSIIFYGFGWDDMCEKCVGLSGIDFHIICGCLIRLTDDIHDRT